MRDGWAAVPVNHPALRPRGWIMAELKSFGIINRQAVRRGSFTSVKDFIDAMRTFIDGWSNRGSHFTWTKDADTSPVYGSAAA